MKKTRIMPFLLMLIMTFSIMHASAAASERNIYVGDIIELKISSQNQNEAVIREKFKDFEVVGLVEESDHFILKVRTFETGEKRVVLGDKEIVIVVKSTLQDIQSDGPMEGGLGPATSAPAVPWLYILIALLAASAVTGVLSLKGRFATKSKVRPAPYQHFISQSSSLLYEDNEFFVKLTSYFKEYIEAVYQCRIKGMTSAEILYTVDKLPRMLNVKQELKCWLRECDFFKFTGTTASGEKKQEMQRKLAELAGRIDAANRAVQGSPNRAAQVTANQAIYGTAERAVSGTAQRNAHEAAKRAGKGAVPR